jgi:hypothetical protein
MDYLRYEEDEDENYNGGKKGEATRATSLPSDRSFGTPLLGSPVSKAPEAEEPPAYRDWVNYENYLDKYVHGLEDSIGPAQYMVLTAAIRRGKDSRSRRKQTLENAYILNKACRHFHFKHDTYFLATFLAVCARAENLFEVGVCLFMSDKYEEMYAHKWKDLFGYLGVKTCIADIIQQELVVLGKVNFQVHRPLMHFLTVQFLRSSKASEESIEIANMMLKLILLEEPYFKNNFTDMAIAICSMILRETKEHEANLKFSMMVKTRLESLQVTRFRQNIRDWIATVLKMKPTETTEPFIELAKRVTAVLDPKALKQKPFKFDTATHSSAFNDILN